MKIERVVQFVAIIVLFGSCQEDNTKLELALKLSGNNRHELEKVIKHYSESSADSLKLKSALFLIENMPGHYTLESDVIKEYNDKVTKDTQCYYFSKKVFDISLNHFIGEEKDVYKKEDIHHIKADYLIRHIDASFELLQKYSWLDLIPFDTFLEYILPYRFENESLDFWRDSLHVASYDLDVKLINNTFANTYSNYASILHLQEEKLKDLDVMNKLLDVVFYHDCYAIAYSSLLEARVLGIPKAVDYVPCYANRNGYHYWPAEMPLIKKMDIQNIEHDRGTAKIYRRTFSHNTIVVPGKNEYVPDFFVDPFNRDVTDLYLCTEDIKIVAVPAINDPVNHAYLCVFNNLEWKPVAATKLSDRNGKFGKMGKNVLYFPVYYKRDTMKALNYPFILNVKGGVEYLTPDTSVRQKVRLTRKSPAHGTIFYYYKLLYGAVIEGANDIQFKNSDTVFTFQETDQLLYSQENVNCKQYRYYRVRKKSKKKIDIAELIFWGRCGEKVKGDVLPSFTTVFDENPLTNACIEPDSDLVIDFRQPVVLSKFVCLPRSDGNGIYPGNRYELLYCDLDGWRSLGKKVATDYYIEYDNIPKNALCWLRNLTTGIEERVFTYRDEYIRFW